MMGWKEYAETLEVELQQEQRLVAGLRRRVAEQQEQHSAPVNSDLARQKEGLAKQLKEAKSNNERLSKQLQQEKAANVGRLNFMANNTEKSRMFGDGDDEEELLPGPAGKKALIPAGEAKKKHVKEVPPPFKKNVSAATYGAPLSPVSPMMSSYFATKRPVLSEKNTKTGSKKPEKTSTTTSSKKRKRSHDEPQTLLDEVADLPSFEQPLESRRGGRNRRLSYKEADVKGDTIVLAHRPKPNALAPIPFEFSAICDYHPDGSEHRIFSSSDLSDRVADLWQRIDICARNTWTKHKGEDWQYDFQRTDFKPKNPVCVSKKCQGGRATWRSGFEGMFACRSCVQENRPCFVYVLKPEWKWSGEGDKGVFKLLPLHEKDRRRPVKKDFETRWWINDDGMEEGVFSSDEDDFVDC